MKKKKAKKAKSGGMRYGKQNPLRLALPILKKRYLIVVPQRGGIWVGGDIWVTYGSPEVFIVDRERRARESLRREVMTALETTKLGVLKGGIFDLGDL